MTCPRCHAENRDGLRFCEDCGSRLTLACSQCGAELAPGKRFCGACGAPAAGQSAASTPSPESYTPKHLAEKILTSKSALEGERKQVTVLFADLKGSMELLADRDPEEARKLLDPVLERMMEAVHRYEGTVNQVMGDGIMALFGAPLAHEDHAVRACYAALRMQDSVKQYAEGVRRAEGVLVQIRVGLNSGEVVVRSIGNDLHMDYTAVGQTTHLAGRMEQMAAPGSILLTAEVLRLAEGYVGVKPLGPMSVKGLSAPIEVYEVTGAGPVRTRLQASAARGLTRFVGRDREVEALRQALERAASGHGQLVAIVGEPGVGKSRLVAEALLHALLGDDATLRPLPPLLIERTEGNPFFLEESVRTLVETHALIGERGAYRLGTALPSIQVPTTVQAILAARIDRLPADEKRLLQTASVIGTEVALPLLQAVADLPEEDLRRGLAHLQAAEFLYETRLFPDVEYTFKHALTHEVAYGGLLQERRRALHARIVEAIERLYADRLIEQVDRLAHHAFRGEVWEKALSYGRQAGARAFARSANREALACWEQALAALVHLPESRETMEQAIDLRIDVRSALQRLGELPRSLGYLREAQALAGTLGDQRRLGVVFSQLAGYFYVTGAPDDAIEASRRTLDIATTLGDSALQVVASYRLGLCHHNEGDYRRATGFLRRTVEALKGDLVRARLGMAGPVSALALTWLVACLVELGQFTEAVRVTQDGARLAEALDDPYSLTMAARGIGHLRVRQGEPQQAISALEHGLRLCRSMDLPLVLPSIASQLGHAYALSGRIAEALPLLAEAVQRGDGMGVMMGQAQRVTSLGDAYLRAGRRDDAVRQAERALDLARAHKERGNQAWALRLLGEVAAHPDPPDRESAERHYREALTLANELGMRPLVAHCHLGVGTLYRRLGKRERAREHLTTATTMYREMGMTYWLEKAHAELGGVER